MNDFMQPWYFQSVVAQIGPLQIHWYGVMYALAFLIGYLFLHYGPLGKKLGLNSEAKDSLLVAVILGVLIGGRLGYILFYNLGFYLANPLKIFSVWEGGMSFHGGFLGVAVALVWFSRKHRVVKLFALSDFVTSVAPLGIMLGRIGNFINGELYGRVAHTAAGAGGDGGMLAKLCLYFPADPQNCRYPSQLFESFLEGLVLFVILYLVSKYSKKTGLVTAIFLLCYGVFRIMVEFFREPDPQIGYLLGGLTEGQILSGLMVAGGGILLWMLTKRDSLK